MKCWAMAPTQVPHWELRNVTLKPKKSSAATWATFPRCINSTRNVFLLIALNIPSLFALSTVSNTRTLYPYMMLKNKISKVLITKDIKYSEDQMKQMQKQVSSAMMKEWKQFL